MACVTPPDNRAMSSAYLWVKAFHIVFVASWFAALFYLPRLFVNLAAVPADSHAERERLLLMARQLVSFLAGCWRCLRCCSACGCGSASASVPAQAGCMLKLLLVVLTLGYHHACAPVAARFEHVDNRRSERWYRIFNETAVLLFAAIVVLVVVKPF